jgi:hypothetical protein
MPATNPRLTITLQPRLAAQLRRLSQLTGNSQSSLIAELLEGSTAVFDRLIAILEAAEQAKGTVEASLKGKLTSDMDAAQAQIEKQLGLALETFDSMGDDLITELEQVKRRSGRRGAPLRGEPPARSAGTTPMSNRGVRSSTPNTKVNKKGQK